MRTQITKMSVAIQVHFPLIIVYFYSPRARFVGDLGAVYKGNFIDFARCRRVFWISMFFTRENVVILHIFLAESFLHFSCRKIVLRSFSTFFL